MKTITSTVCTFAVLVLVSDVPFITSAGTSRATPLPNARHVPLSDLKSWSAGSSATSLPSRQRDDCDENVLPQIRVDSGHPWKPPFGVDRVGALPVVHLELTSEGALRRQYYVVAYRSGRESERQSLNFERNPDDGPSNKTTKDTASFFGNAQLTSIPEEVVLYARCQGNGQVDELTRKQIKWPDLEVDVAARPNRQINPVDLGSILVPHDWLLLAGGQTALISAAAITHTGDIPDSHLRVWFEGEKAVEIDMPLAVNHRTGKELELPLTSKGDRTVLHVSLTDGNRELWKKEIQTMTVTQLPHWPSFGAVETKLRYDAPISMHDSNTGAALPSIDYNTAWNSKFNDVVVFLPNGSRFVFWRGSSYVPFWAGLHNTGISYQWAENLAIPVHHLDGAVDLPEPLFDRELRYGHVHIIESTPSRVHVRWTYQLTDVHYNVWGDQATEDYYFYPDGFGTRVISVISVPNTPYQLTEFIILTPQAAFPFDVLPGHMADILFLDGEKKSITFPFPREKNMSPGQPVELASNARGMPMVYRLFGHKDDSAAAIYFSPQDPTMPGAYGPLYDRGEMATPMFWGSHWPLGRGKWTHWTIDDDIYSTPAHNSVAGWMKMPKPLSTSEFAMPDMLGHSQNLTLQRWVALIADTAATDDVLLEWAQSFSDPPSLEVTGAHIDFPSYSPERRALRLIADSSSIEIKLKPVMRTVNPVFELDRAPKGSVPKGSLSVMIDGKPLATDEYAWDGSTLWIKASIGVRGARIGLQFK